MRNDQIRCGCGSGLRRARCCELNSAALPAPEAERHLGPLIERARQAYAEADLAIAEQLCLDVLELSPGQLEGHTLLYELRKSQQHHAAAEVLLSRVVVLHPNTFWATSELALGPLRKGRIAEAELHARNAVRIAPKNPQSHNLLGMILTEANRPQVGEFHYRRVLELTKPVIRVGPTGRSRSTVRARFRAAGPRRTIGSWRSKRASGARSAARRMHEHTRGQPGLAYMADQAAELAARLRRFFIA